MKTNLKCTLLFRKSSKLPWWRRHNLLSFSLAAVQLVMNLVFQLLMNLLLWSIPKHSVEIICLVFGKFHIEMQILYSWGKVTHLNSVLSTFSPRFLTIFSKKGTFVERFSTITRKFLSIVFCLVDNLSKTMFGNSKQSEFPALYWNRKQKCPV